MQEQPRPQVILQSTGAIGDTVIATALIPALQAIGFATGHICSASTFPLWHHLPHACAFKPEDSLPSHAIVVDIRNYQHFSPHTAKPFQHLCHYMLLQLIQGLSAQDHHFSLPQVSRDDVKLALTPDEYGWGQQSVKQLSQAHDEKPIILLAPCARSANRSLDPLMVMEIGEKLRKFALPVLLDPLSSSYHRLGIARFGTDDLRKVAALLAAADAVITVDSGPLHLAAAARQGMSEEVKRLFNVENDLANIILIAGSSHPAVVGYRGMQEIVAGRECSIAPCGMHGYDDLEIRGQEFARPVYRHRKDASGCIYSEYPHMLTARCMHSISTDQVVEAAKRAISIQ